MSLPDANRSTLAAIASSLGPAPPENAEATKKVQMMLEKLEQRYAAEMAKENKRSGLNMILPKEVAGGEAVTVFGHVEGVKPGAKFKDRGQLYVAGLHVTLMKGIHAPSVKHPDYERGAYSVVMSGGYVDDEDMGESFWYTGEGGIDKGRQVKDQSFDRGSNAALRNSCTSRTPVRVIRGFIGGGTAGDAPEASGDGGQAAEGQRQAGGKKDKGFVYEGLYAVLQCKQEASKDGPQVCKFLMHGVPGHSTVNTKVEFGIFGGVSMEGRLHARRLAADTSRSVVPSAKRARMDKDRKAVAENRKAMLAEIHRLYDSMALLSEDVSNGQEAVPIPLVNEVNDETLPSSFTYIREYSWAPGVYELVAPTLRFADEEMEEFTRARENGTCGLAFNRRICALDRRAEQLPQGYDPHLEEQYNNLGCLMVTDPCGVHECGEACTSAKCRLNKQLTNGVVLPLEVFMTPAKGWGVRCREAILAGAFVCTYVGQLLTDHMADVRKGVDHYLFNLDFFAHIYTEIAQKGLEAIAEEIPLYKIPPVMTISQVRQIQAAAAAEVRKAPPADNTTTATDAAGPASQQDLEAEAGPLSPSFRAVGPDGLMPREAVPAAAKGLLASCSALAAAAEGAGDGDPGAGDAAAGGIAVASSGLVESAASTLLRLRGNGGPGSEPGPSGGETTAAPAGTGRATQAAKGAALASAAAAAADGAAADPGAFYLQPIFSRADAPAAGGAGSTDAAEAPARGGVGLPYTGEEEEYAPILVLDARTTGNVGRFINHSCDGNLTIQAVFAGVYRNTLLYHVGLFACKDIPAMQELTYNYGYHNQANAAGGSYDMECHCGAENCVGQLM